MDDTIKERDVALALSELDYCLDHEMIQRVDDFLIRRTGRLYFDIHSISKIKEDVLSTMADRLDWDEDRTQEERTRLGHLLDDATTYYQNEKDVTSFELTK